MAQDKKLRTGKLARSAITGIAVAQAGIAHIGHKMRKPRAIGALGTEQQQHQAEHEAAHDAAHQAELGRILFRALNQLKGTALKASQLLSMEAGLLPEGLRAELARGFHQATPLNRALIHKVFRQEFSQDVEQLYRRFDTQAFAAASLGQVHHAELHDGTPVVVKVQYPGIATSIGSDMRMIRTILQGLSLGANLLPNRHIVDRVLTDLEHKLEEEVDYQHEAEQLRWFGTHVQRPHIVIPQPVLSHTTRRVLTMQAVQGLHLDTWLATNPDQQARNQAGQLLFDWFLHGVFDWRRLHADPHPGNFLFLPDGQLGIVDFGCTKMLTSEFSLAIASAWRALLRHDHDALRHAYIELALISPDLPIVDFIDRLMPSLAPMQAWQIEPFRQQHFDYAKRLPYPILQPQQNRAMAQHIEGIREELPYFERAYLGIDHMLKKLEATVVTHNPWIHGAYDE